MKKAIECNRNANLVNTKKICTKYRACIKLYRRLLHRLDMLEGAGGTSPYQLEAGRGVYAVSDEGAEHRIIYVSTLCALLRALPDVLRYILGCNFVVTSFAR
jgi:hypothetical protein